MQTAFKLFDIFPVKATANMPALNKIALKFSAKDQSISEEAAAGFMQMMSELLAMQPEQVQQSLEKLDWVQAEGAAQGLAPLIDLTDTKTTGGSFFAALFQAAQDSSGMIDDVQKWFQSAAQSDGLNASQAAGFWGLDGSVGQPPAGIKEQMPIGFTQTAAGTCESQAGQIVDQNIVNQQLSEVNLIDGAEDEAEKEKTAQHVTGPASGKSEETQDALGKHVPDFVRQWLSENKSRERTENPGLAHARGEIDDSGMQIEASVRDTGKDESDSARAHTSQSPYANDLLSEANEESLIKEEVVFKGQEPAAQTDARPSSSARVLGSEALPKDPAAQNLPKEMQSDVIRQIVQKMSFRSDGQQSRMQIKLKPEFLGDIRMQIITENQKVMVRMTADSYAVKEIIEKNMPFLKSELQQHGLQIEKFEVLVGQDNDGWKNQSQQSAAFRHAQQRKSYRNFGVDKARPDEDADPSGARIGPAQQGNHGHHQLNEIDYFA